MKTGKRMLCMVLTLILVLSSITGGATVSAAKKTKATVKVGTTFKSGSLRYKVTSVNGKSGTVSVVGAKSKSVTKVSIPEQVKYKKCTFQVTQIANNAFKNYKKLKKVTTNTQLQVIGSKAFYGCKKLTSINIKSDQLKQIGGNALKGIAKKATIQVPKQAENLLQGKGLTASVNVQTYGAAVAQTAAPKQTEAPKAAPQVRVAPQTEAAAKANIAPQTEAKTEATEPETQAKEQDAPKADVGVQITPPQAEGPSTEETQTDAPETEVKTKAETEKETEAETKVETEQETEQETEPATTEPETEPTTTEPEVVEQQTDATVAETTEHVHSYGEVEIQPIEGSHCYGRQVRKCTSCGDIKYESSSAIHREDVLLPLLDIEPTCENPGSVNRKYCPYCKQEYFGYVKPLGHNYSEEVKIEEGSCEQDKYSYKECTRCGKREVVAILEEAPGHQWEDATTPATCTAEGFKGQQCAVCGEKKGRVLPVTEHQYVRTRTEATCEEAGEVKDVCSVCGDTVTSILPPTGKHAWKTYPQVEATCVKAGHSEYTQCSICHKYQGEAPVEYPATGQHTWKSVKATSNVSVASVKGGDGQELDERFTFFVDQCEGCGCYEIKPGAGGIGEDQLTAGNICWILFLTEGEWSGNYDPNYCCQVYLDGKVYAGYLLARRGEVFKTKDGAFNQEFFKKVSEELGLSADSKWQAVDAQSKTPEGGAKALAGFELNDIGRTFVACNE